MKMTKEEKKKSIVVGSDGGRGEKIAGIRRRKGEGEKEEKGKTVVVGVKMDPQSRELLTWALVKVADAGDRVIALHVLPFSATEALDSDGQSSSLLSLVKAFDSVLAVYEGFCNLKQIDLKLKICRGLSIRKVLVREVYSYTATKLILGIAKNNRAIGSSSTSIAKYCAKKLPHDCSVLAVNNGKVVFQREAENKKAADHGLLTCTLSTDHRTSSKHSKLPNGRAGNLDCKLAIMGKNTDRSRSSPHPSVTKDSCSRLSDVSTIQSCSICAPASVPPCSPAQGGNETHCIKSEEEKSLALVTVRELEAPSSSISLLIGEFPEVKPGWPLLQKAVLTDKKNASLERSKISVVQWAMRLPNRYSTPSAVYPNQKPLNSDASTTSNLDGESGAIVSVGIDSPHPSVPIHGLDGERKLPKELESLQEKYSSVCRLFTYKELMHATSNFLPENLIGKGGSSRVYKGCLPDGKELAVKILKPTEDAMKEFVLEIEIITTLHHKNIISLFGFCYENTNLLLVYDLLSRGSLEENLHGENSNKKVLSWIERYKVAVGVAEALDYLHGGGSPQPVIHRDVKSSNILLSDNCEPQLSDFGLAIWASTSASHITCSDVAGTFGYLAPEYFMYGKVNEKIDVYAFGVVLLELLSGRKPISTGCPKGQESLVMWAKPILQGGKLKQLVDPSLSNKYDNDQMERMILAASLCIRRAPRSRPQIALVSKLLRGDDDVLKWARFHVSASDEFDGLDDETTYPDSNILSHLNLALLDIEEDSLSDGSIEHTVDFITAHSSMEDYLKGRWSRSSSFD